MRIGILGTGAIASALGGRWSRAGHHLTVAGRTAAKATDLAARLSARAATIREAVVDADAVLLAVAWEGVADILREAGPPAGTVLIDPTNAVEHGVGVLHTASGESGAQRIAALAPGSHVVKAFHLFPSDQWSNPAAPPETVAICGDDPHALDITRMLVRDAGAEPALLGGLDRARQLEEVAGFTIALAFAGVDPCTAIPHVPIETLQALNANQANFRPA
ncbi:MAG TPA: NAD(P)-binding domain-containing protein [Pseudonocardiaceae bacterium]